MKKTKKKQIDEVDKQKKKRFPTICINTNIISTGY